MCSALHVMRLSFQDTWHELWTILIVHILFLFGNILMIPGPPAIIALFFYGNRIAHGETADEHDFLKAVRKYWGPAWKWGFINLLVVGLLAGDYYLTGKIANHFTTVHFIQGLYTTLLAGWLLFQLFALPFLFEQEQPAVFQAWRNAAVFVRRNMLFVCILLFLLVLSLTVGTFVFMLTFVFGGAFIAFASNRAIIEHIAVREVI